MSEEQAPLRLQDLANVESPEIMRAALRRFRRRSLKRSLAVVLAIATSILIFRGLRSERRPTLEERLAIAQTQQIGRVLQGKTVSVIVLDVRHIPSSSGGSRPGPPPLLLGRSASGYFLHLTVVAKRIRNDETLTATAGPSFEMAGPPVERPTDARLATRAVDVFIPFEPGASSVTLKVLALTGRDGGERGPGTHRQSDCAEPLNTLGVCELLKTEGRIVEQISIGLDALGIQTSGGTP